MKTSIFILLMTSCALGQTMAQNTLIDQNGTASFFSEAPMENIDATNKKVLGAIDLDKGTLAVSMLIKDFHFERSLMEEHFNENYLESDKFPKATFKGEISNFTKLNLTKNGSFEVEVKGELVIHGVTKPLQTMVKFEVSGSKLAVSTVFDISVAEFDIEVPTLVIKNIAEVVEVKASFNFMRK